MEVAMDSKGTLGAIALMVLGGTLAASECLAATGAAGAPPKSGAAVWQQAHTEYDRVLDASFAATVDAGGNAVTTMETGDLVLEKTVSPAGAATLQITRAKDVVSVTVGQRGYTVTRGKRSASFDPGFPRQDDVDAVRAVLVGSKAVRGFREFTGILEARADGEDCDLELAALVDGAMVAMLDGDPGAVERIARRVTAKRRNGLRQAQYRPVQFEDCVLNYELSLLYSYDLYWTCLQTAEATAWYFWYFAKSMCDWEFLIRSQQYVFQFVTCTAIPM
jgi:hypothetical protein